MPEEPAILKEKGRAAAVVNILHIPSKEAPSAIIPRCPHAYISNAIWNCFSPKISQSGATWLFSPLKWRGKNNNTRYGSTIQGSGQMCIIVAGVGSHWSCCVKKWIVGYVDSKPNENHVEERVRALISQSGARNSKSEARCRSRATVPKRSIEMGHINFVELKLLLNILFVAMLVNGKFVGGRVYQLHPSGFIQIVGREKIPLLRW